MSYRYIGSKARIADHIIEFAGNPETGRFIDAFCGAGSVAASAARNGWKIWINDALPSALIQARARLLSAEDVPFLSLGGYSLALAQLNDLKPIKGFFWREYSPASKNYCGIERKYFSEENAMKIDAIRSTITLWRQTGLLSDLEECLLLNDLIKAVNDVANIAGTYGCYFSSIRGQALETLKLVPSQLLSNPHDVVASNLDVFEIMPGATDVVYLDPPYTKRQYAAYYHILETIAAGDEPHVAGVSGLRPWKQKASVFCYKTKALDALFNLVRSLACRRVLLSYSNEGYVDLEELVKRLEGVGSVEVINLQKIARYSPNKGAASKKEKVQEYLIIFERRGNE